MELVPKDVLFYILRFCDVRTLVALSQTCKKMYRATNDPFVWKLQVNNLKEDVYDYMYERKNVEREKNWKQFYVFLFVQRQMSSSTWKTLSFSDYMTAVNESKRSIESGTRWLEKGKPAAALKFFEQAFRLNPCSATANAILECCPDFEKESSFEFSGKDYRSKGWGYLWDFALGKKKEEKKEDTWNTWKSERKVQPVIEEIDADDRVVKREKDCSIF